MVSIEGQYRGPVDSNLARVHRRPVEVRQDQLVDGRVGVGDVAGNLLAVEPLGEKRERLGHVVAGVELGLGVVDRPAVEPRGRARLEPRACEARDVAGHR